LQLADALSSAFERAGGERRHEAVEALVADSGRLRVRPGKGSLRCWTGGATVSGCIRDRAVCARSLIPEGFPRSRRAAERSASSKVGCRAPSPPVEANASCNAAERAWPARFTWRLAAPGAGTPLRSNRG
jgi:hypothetical protein